MSWILTIILSSGLMVPVADFADRAECEKALEMWTLEPGVRIDCFSSDDVEVEPDRRKQRRRRR